MRSRLLVVNIHVCQTVSVLCLSVSSMTLYCCYSSSCEFKSFSSTFSSSREGQQVISDDEEHLTLTFFMAFSSFKAICLYSVSQAISTYIYVYFQTISSVELLWTQKLLLSNGKVCDVMWWNLGCTLCGVDNVYLCMKGISSILIRFSVGELVLWSRSLVCCGLIKVNSLCTIMIRIVKTCILKNYFG